MSHVYKTTESVVTRKIAGETLLVPVTGNLPDLRSIFALDDISALVWNRLDGKNSVSDIVTAVVEEYDVSAETAETDVTRFLEDVVEKGLVVEG